MLAQIDLDSIQDIGSPSFRFGGGRSGDLGGIITALLPYVFSLAGIGLLVYLILGGLSLMTAKGDPKAIQSAQAKITNALIGFVIIIISYVVVQLLGQILGLESNTLFKQLFGG